ncbi:MAG: hypothetical protein ABGX20_05570 [Bacillus sp. (in: firmicutes)]
MNIPQNYFEKLLGLNEEVNEAFKSLNCLQSALDRKIAEIYHQIEANEFDIAQGNEYAKKLKETLQYRRVIKDEMARLIPVYNMLRAEVGKVNEQYDRAVRKGFELKQSLNVTLGIEEVLAAIDAG